MKAGWEIKRLPEIAEYFIGLTYSPKDVSTKGTVVLRSSNIQNDEIDLSDLVRVARSVKESLKVRDGDILMCSRNGSKRLVGKTAVISSLPEEMTFGTFMMVIRGKQNPYLAWFFKSDAFRQQIGVGENTMINQITKYMLDAIRVPLPPLAEQQRIVGILDDAFDSIATAKATADQNLKNARALFESHLQSVFTRRGEGWEDRQLSHVCVFVNGRAYKKEELLVAGKYPVLRVGNFFTNNHWYHSDLELEPDKYCDTGDLLYAWSASFGPRIWEGGKVIYHYHIWKVLPNTELVDKRFLLHLLEWDVEQIKLAHGTGTTMMHVSKGSMESRVVPIPPLKDQERIVSQLDELKEETQRLESLYQRKLAALDELKKSLLHQAFSGAL